MHWWQSAFFSSPSSSSTTSSSSKSYADHSLLNKISRFSSRGRRFRSQKRRFIRPKELPHLSDNEVGGLLPPLDTSELWRSPSALELSPARSSSAAAPHPLPLPELALLPPRDANLVSSSNSGDLPLPSPKEVAGRGSGEEREKFYDLNGDGVIFGRLTSRDTRRITEHAQPQLSRKFPRELNGVERSKGNYKINLPMSAPTSPYSSTVPSPQRSTGDFYTSHYMTPQVGVWSAPEMPPSDMTLGLGFPYHTSHERIALSLDCSPLHSPRVSPHQSTRNPIGPALEMPPSDMTLGLGFPYQISHEKIAFSVDSSPFHSPRVSPRRSTRNPSGPASPLHKKLSVETPTARCESIAQANVHPLPLPPGPTVPSQPALVPHATVKQELMSLKCQWQKGKLIGRGTFGSVYVASNRETGALCAMKEVELLPDDPKSAECMRQLEQEIKVLSQLKHPNIVQYYGSEIVDDRFYIYLEYVHPGSINKYIRDHCGAITESVVRNFTRHILSGLAYLHSTKTIHRDIKGANLLVDAYGVVKLADFGMAKHLTGQAADLSLKGSPHWMAPELLQSVMQKDARADLALAVDIWSLGCTIIEMLIGKPPWSEYEGAAAMFKVMRKTPPIPETLSSEGKDFLRCCFRRNPADRPTASKLLEHQFLKNVQHLDVPSCTQLVNGMKLTDKAQTPHDRSSLPLSSDAQTTTKGKLANNETDRQSHYDLIPVSRHSPRSTLEALPSLSPPRLDYSTGHPSPSANVPTSIKKGAKKNHTVRR